MFELDMRVDVGRETNPLVQLWNEIVVRGQFVQIPIGYLVGQLGGHQLVRIIERSLKTSKLKVRGKSNTLPVQGTTSQRSLQVLLRRTIPRITFVLFKFQLGGKIL